jgi:REP element-mobilizing transposase RayT
VVEPSDTTGNVAALPHPEGVTAMPSTFLSLHYHVVFSTKNREPSIDLQWRSRLYDYLGGTIRGLEGQSEIIGGTADHIHLLLDLKATHALADFMRELKKLRRSGFTRK